MNDKMDLKDCPYCGGQPTFTVYMLRGQGAEGKRRGTAVMCSDCDLRGPAGETERAAVAYWNAEA